MKVVLVARVSHTDGSQTTKSQVDELKLYAERHKFHVIDVVETAESVRTGRKSHQLFHKYIDQHEVDAFVFTETCRISRDLLDLLLIINLLHKNNIAVIITSFGGKSLDEEGLIDSSVMSMIRMQGLFAQMDNELRSRRVKRGCKKGLKPLRHKKYCGDLSRDQAIELFKLKKSRYIDKPKKIKATNERLAEIYNMSTLTIFNFIKNVEDVGLKKYLDQVDEFNAEIDKQRLDRSTNNQ